MSTDARVVSQSICRVHEAEDHQGQPWGERALEELMCTCGGSTTKEVIRRILAELSAFANGEPQRDDMTLLGVKVLSTPSV